MVDMMKKYHNVYYDISAHGIDRKGMLRDAVNKVGKERILYGTDYPGYDPALFINSVIHSGLTDDEQEFIFYKNAERLQVTKEFVKFMLSDESLRYFMRTTGSPMPYKAEMTASDFEQMTPFARNVYELYNDTENVYIPNTSILRFGSPIRFVGGMGVDNAYSTADGSTPLLLVKTQTLAKILSGLKDQSSTHENNWADYLTEVQRQGFTL